MKPGDSLTSPNFECRAFLSPDGNFAIYRIFPETFTKYMLWNSGTHRHPNSILKLTNEGLQLFDNNSKLIWMISVDGQANKVKI